MSFGYKLASLRKLKNLTRKELAEILSISYPALSNYENNERFPDQEMLITIADYFDVSIDYLLDRTDIKYYMDKKDSVPNAVSEDFENQYDNEYILDIKGLSSANKDRIKDYIRILKLLEDNNLEIEKED